MRQGFMRYRFIVLKKRTAIGFLFSISVLFFIVPVILVVKGLPIYHFMGQQYTILIDPGHGGIDGGTSKEGVLEKEINLDIGKKLRAILEKRGYRVVMTREEDVSLDSGDRLIKNRHAEDLKNRVETINNSSAHLFVSIHVNCNIKKPKTEGSIVFYNSINEANQPLALCIQRSLNSIMVSGKKRTVHDPREADFYLLKHTSIPGVLVETAFVSNATERELLQKESFRGTLAESIADGIDSYFTEAR